MCAEDWVGKEKGAIRSVLMRAEGASGEVSVIGAGVIGTGESLIRRYAGVIVVVVVVVVKIRGSSHRGVGEVVVCSGDLVVLATVDGCRGIVVAVGNEEVGLLLGCSARTEVG